MSVPRAQDSPRDGDLHTRGFWKRPLGITPSGIEAEGEAELQSIHTNGLSWSHGELWSWSGKGAWTSHWMWVPRPPQHPHPGRAHDLGWGGCPQPMAIAGGGTQLWGLSQGNACPSPKGITLQHPPQVPCLSWSLLYSSCLTMPGTW